MKTNLAVHVLLSTLILAGCQKASPAGAAATPDGIIRSQIVASAEGITDYGWLPDGRVFYGVGGIPDVDDQGQSEDIDQTRWFAVDPDSMVVSETPRPYPSMQADQLELLGGALVQDATFSPSGESALITRLPADFVRPAEPGFHSFDPKELWAAEGLVDGANTSFPILNDPDDQHHCGLGLSRESQWYEDESLVLGSCYFETGIIRVYFLADLPGRSIQFLNFFTEDGFYIPSEEIAAAHASPRLAFYSEKGLVLISPNPGSAEVPLTLTPENVLFDDRPAISPVWSADDKWIYYWTLGEATTSVENVVGDDKAWWLERVDPATRTREVVLGEAGLLAIMGREMYTPWSGIWPIWRLSDDQSQILLYLDETTDSPAALFLITL